MLQHTPQRGQRHGQRPGDCEHHPVQHGGYRTRPRFAADAPVLRMPRHTEHKNIGNQRRKSVMPAGQQCQRQHTPDYPVDHQ